MLCICGGQKKGDDKIEVTSVALNEDVIELQMGSKETVTLVATVKPDNASNKRVTWKSSDEAVVTVVDGVVTALKAGNATVTATAGGKSDSCSVAVLPESQQPTPQPVAVTEVTLNKNEASLKVNETVTLEETVAPATATNKKVTWTSDKPAVAKVENGVVTAVAEGTAIITVTTEDGSHTATCTITVTADTTVDPQPPTPPAPTDYTTGTHTLNVEATEDHDIFTSQNGASSTDGGFGTSTKDNVKRFKLGSDDYLYVNMKLQEKKVIKITGTARPSNDQKTVKLHIALHSDSDGEVTGIKPDVTFSGTGGAISETITVTKEGIIKLALSRSTKDTGCEITEFVVEITDPQPVNVEKVEFNKTTAALKVGETDTLTATVTPANADNTAVTWTSSDETIATVVDGVVTAKKAGTATVTVTADGGKTATCEVTVTNIAVTSVTLNKTEVKLAVGKTVNLTATVEPENATIKTVTWASAKTAYATVDTNGVVTAVAVGTATITATADGGITATCQVTVVAEDIPVESVTLNETSIAKNVGDTLQLNATVEPANAIDSSVEWTTDKASVATVDQNGLVTIVGEGTVKITVTSNNNPQAKAECVIEATYKTFTVRFISEGKEAKTQTVRRGETATSESIDKEGYALLGWYKEEACTNLYDFSTPVTADVTLYAKWIVSQIKITYQQGNWESAAVEWEESNPKGATVEYKLASVNDDSKYVQVDNELIRKAGEGKARVDILGLKGNETYNIRITSSTKGVSIVNVAVKSYDRSGYAHFGYTEGVGAYKDDGTLKDNAVVIYVTDENKNTVSVTHNGITVTGIGNILNSVGQDIGGGATAKGGKPNTNQGIIKKLAESNIPLVVRFIGGVSDSGLYKKGTFAASSTPKIDGLTIYDNLDNGGSVGDNGHMARMKSGKDITLEGVGEDAVIDGWGFHFMAESSALDFGKSFEVRNLTFINTPEDAIGMEGIQEGDTITAGVERCWIHNNEFYSPSISSPAESDKGEGDGSCDFKRGQYLTVSYNYFEGCHKTNLVGSSDDSLQYNLTYHHNYWRLCAARGPLARNANIHMYNNLFEGQTDYAMNPRANAYIFSEYNLFYMCKNPQQIKSGAIKSYNDSFSSCIGAMDGTVVKEKSQTVQNSCQYAAENIDYSKFEINAEQSYIPNGNYELQESVTEARKDIASLTGVIKRNAKSASDITLSEISYLPGGVTPEKITTYPSTVNPGKIEKTVYAFNLDRYATVNVSLSGAGVLVNEAGECLLTGNGSATLSPGTYMVQPMEIQPGDAVSLTNGTFKSVTITSISFEEYNSEKFDAKLIADYDTKAGLIKLDEIGYNNESYTLIVNAQNAYNALKPELQAKVTVPYTTVTAAFDKYIGLGKTEVEGLINAIGTVNEDSGSKITAARSAYDALKELSSSITVSNYSTLTAAEEAYEGFKVTGLINDITALAEASSVTEEQPMRDLLAQYQAIQARYEALDATQKTQVANYKKVTDGITALTSALKPFEVKEMIANLPEASAVTLTDSAAITAARTAYDGLTAAQKEGIDIARLTAAEEALKTLASVAKVAIFTKNDTKLASDAGFTLGGKIGYKGSSDTFEYNGTTYEAPLKMQSETTVSFTTATTMKITIVVHSDGSQIISVDGTKYTATGNTVEIELAAGSHTISKGEKEAWLCYVVLTPVA